MTKDIKENAITLVELFTIIPSITFIFSILYIFGYSQSASIPIISLMKINDFIISTLPWIIPSTLVFGSSMIIGIISGRLEKKTNIEKKISKPKLILNSDTFMFFIIYSITLVPAILTNKFTLFSPSALYGVLFIIVVAFWEFGVYTKWGEEFLKMIPRKYWLLFNIFLIGLIIAYTNGLEHGKSGRNVFLFKNVNVIKYANNEEKIVGNISFCVGDFILFYPQSDSIPILLKKELITEITSFKKTPKSNKTNIIKKSKQENIKNEFTNE